MAGGANGSTKARRVRAAAAWLAPLLGAASLGIVALPAAATGTAAAPLYRDYVALGDSYTADILTGSLPPTTQFVPFFCLQSPDDYPHQVARLLHVAAFHDQSCGSATTGDMTQPQGLAFGETSPPQFAALSAATDLVTVGLGGNDVGFVNDAEACLNLTPVPVPGASPGLGGSCAATDTAGGVDRIDQAIKASALKIAAMLAGIRQRAPHARILLVNYLDAVPLNGKGCWPVVPVQDEDMAYLTAKYLEMNDMLAFMATLEHVQVVDTFTPTIGHDVCQLPTVRDVEGLIPLSLNRPGLNAPLHPNGAGAAAQTRAVYAAVTEGG